MDAIRSCVFLPENLHTEILKDTQVEKSDPILGNSFFI